MKSHAYITTHLIESNQSNQAKSIIKIAKLTLIIEDQLQDEKIILIVNQSYGDQFSSLSSGDDSRSVSIKLDQNLQQTDLTFSSTGMT